MPWSYPAYYMTCLMWHVLRNKLDVTTPPDFFRNPNGTGVHQEPIHGAGTLLRGGAVEKERGAGRGLRRAGRELGGGGGARRRYGLALGGER